MILNLNFILNFIFIGIPETFIFIFLVLFFIKEDHYFRKKNLKKAIRDIFIVGVLPTALFLNTLYYFEDLNFVVRMFLNSIIYFISINNLIKFSIKESLWNKHLKSYDLIETHLPEKHRTNTNCHILLKQETEKYTFTIKNNLPKVKYKNKKGIFLSVVCMMTISFTLGTFTAFCLQYITDFDMQTLNVDIINSMLISYPTIIIVVIILYLKYMHVNKGNINHKPKQPKSLK